MERGAFPWRAEFADSSYELSSKLVKSGTDNSVFELLRIKNAQHHQLVRAP